MGGTETGSAGATSEGTGVGKTGSGTVVAVSVISTVGAAVFPQNNTMGVFIVFVFVGREVPIGSRLPTVRFVARKKTMIANMTTVKDRNSLMITAIVRVKLENPGRCCNERVLFLCKSVSIIRLIQGIQIIISDNQYRQTRPEQIGPGNRIITHRTMSGNL